MRLNLFIWGYLIGYVIFSLFADFNNHAWCNAYYIWQSISFGGVFAWWSHYSYLKGEKKEKVKWIFLYSVFMSIWEIVRVFTGLSVNSYLAVMFGFLFATAIVSVLLLKPQGRLALFLNKYLFS